MLNYALFYGTLHALRVGVNDLEHSEDLAGLREIGRQFPGDIAIQLKATQRCKEITARV